MLVIVGKCDVMLQRVYNTSVEGLLEENTFKKAARKQHALQHPCTVKPQHAQTYSSRLDSRQAESSKKEEIEGRGVKNPAQVKVVAVKTCTLRLKLKNLQKV